MPGEGIAAVGVRDGREHGEKERGNRQMNDQLGQECKRSPTQRSQSGRMDRIEGSDWMARGAVRGGNPLRWRGRCDAEQRDKLAENTGTQQVA